MQPRLGRHGKGDRDIRAGTEIGENTHSADDDGDDAKEPICPRRTPSSHQALRHLCVSLHISILWLYALQVGKTFRMETYHRVDRSA